MKLPRRGFFEDAIKKAQQKSIPVPQSAVNFALPYLLKDIPEIQRPEVTVKDGFFDVSARVRKVVEVDLRLRFEIAGVDVSLERQVVHLRRIECPEGAGGRISARLAEAVIRAIVFSAMKASPEDEGRSSAGAVSAEGDLFTVDLAPLGLREILEKYPMTKTLLRFGRIREIRCTDGTFMIFPALDRPRP